MFVFVFAVNFECVYVVCLYELDHTGSSACAFDDNFLLCVSQLIWNYSNFRCYIRNDRENKIILF